MKKSNMLKFALNHVGADIDHRFICNIIRDQYVYPHYNAGNRTTRTLRRRAQDGEKLVSWINHYLRDAPGSGGRGVEAWLAVQHDIGFYLDRNYSEYHNNLLEYRKLWLADMIAYWKSKGD
jgi:hypothetical protein